MVHDEAAKQFLNYIKICQERNDEWLTMDNIYQMLHIFEDNDKGARLFITLTNVSVAGNEELLCMWVQDALRQHDV